MRTDDLVELFHNIGKLKNIKRTGWINNSIEKPESVADHCFRVAFIAMIIGDSLDLDTNKMIRMALLHDIGEAKVGDITPHMGITKEEKHTLEKKAIKSILSNLDNKNQYIELWDEYEEGSTIEAQILNNIDKFEMALQAIEYHEKSPRKNLNEFLLYALSHINQVEVKKLLECVFDANGITKIQP